MFVRLALLFVTVPLLELVLLVQVGRYVGLLPTVALVVVTGILGAALARREGLKTLAKFRAALEAGRMPHRELVEGLLILIAGAVLLTPGLLTDAAGFSLLVPGVRRAVGRRIVSALKDRVVVVGATPPERSRPRDPSVIDVEYEVREDP